jgi:hypothetical protein
MKTMILAALAAFSIGMGVANAQPPHGALPQQSPSNFMQGGGGLTGALTDGSNQGRGNPALALSPGRVIALAVRPSPG